jgi:hyperosmotically inducible protein
MKQPHHVNRLPLLAALALSVALAACGRQPGDERSAGQRLDGAVADAKQAAQSVKHEAQQAVAGAEKSATHAAEATAKASADLAITAKVNAALAVDDKLQALQIRVDTRAGQVTLTGKAPDARSRERATTLALAVNGVREVDNQLVVGGKNG